MDPVENYRPTMPEAVVRDWAQDAQKELVSLRTRIDELSRAYAGQGLAIEELTAERDALRVRVAELEAWISEDGLSVLIAERDRYREALRSILPSQDPLEAELICDWCGEETPFDQAQGKHADNCPWLLAYGTKEPTK